MKVFKIVYTINSNVMFEGLDVGYRIENMMGQYFRKMRNKNKEDNNVKLKYRRWRKLAKSTKEIEKKA